MPPEQPTAPPTGSGGASASSKPGKKGRKKVKHSEDSRKYGSGRVPAAVMEALKSNAFHSSLIDLESSALAGSTWKKYNSVVRTYECYCDGQNVKAKWPIKPTVLSNFVAWCYKKRGLTAGTIRSYLTALRTVNCMMGGGRVKKGKDWENLLLKGVENKGVRPARRPSDPIRFVTLKKIRSELAKKSWRTASKKTVWACCCLGYFGSFRAGELLAKQNWVFDKFSDLKWSDIAFKQANGLVVHVKSPKIPAPNGNFVEIFPFPERSLCPVSALKRLKSLQKKQGVYEKNSPVFRFGSGKNLTVSGLTHILKSLLSHTSHSSLNISAKSLRAGIPSDMEGRPDLVDDEHIKNWGRWRSVAYQRYMKGGSGQKQWIFKKICEILTD